jgi:hypothetical protein
MAQPIYIKKYPAHSPTNEVANDAEDTLEFPVARNFVSQPPQINPQVMLRRIAENIVWHNRRPGEEERRLVEKIPVEFVL